MNYIEYGKENSDVIVLLHGGGLSWWNYKEAAERLQMDYHAQKITGTEADIEKIKSIFLVILKDIKKEFDIPFSDVSSEELQKQLANMRKQALFQKKKNPKFNETNMAKLVMNMFQNMGMDLDEYEQELFQKMIVHMFQRKR